MRALWFIGDKETTLLLHMHLKDVDSVVFLDPGFYHPEIYAYLQEAERFFGFSAIRVDVEVAREKKGINWCEYFRQEVLLPYLSSQGYSEVYEPLREPEPMQTPIREHFPLREMGEYRMWSLIRENHLPICSLYLKGIKKFGCSPSGKKTGGDYSYALKNMGYL